MSRERLQLPLPLPKPERPVQLPLKWRKKESIRESTQALRIERIKEIVHFWIESFPGENLTLRTIRTMIGTPIAPETISRLIDTVRTEDPTFKVPMRGKIERRPKRKVLRFTEASIENVTRGVAELHPEAFASLTEAIRTAGIHHKAGKIAPLLEEAGIRYRRIDVEDHSPSRGIHTRFTKYFVLRTDLPQIVDLLRSFSPVRTSRVS
jgi:Trp operon repressor